MFLRVFGVFVRIERQVERDQFAKGELAGPPFVPAVRVQRRALPARF